MDGDNCFMIAGASCMILIVILLHVSAHCEIPELGPTPTIRSTCRYLKRYLRPSRRKGTE